MKADIKLFKENIQVYGFDDDGQDIVKKMNLSVDKVKKVFLGYQRKINDNASQGKNTLTIVYYGGHGMMKDDHSQIVMPDSEKVTPLYDLEARLRSLGSLPGSFVIGIFDCCRDAFDQSIFPPVESRGGNSN